MISSSQQRGGSNSPACAKEEERASGTRAGSPAACGEIMVEEVRHEDRLCYGT